MDSIYKISCSSGQSILTPADLLKSIPYKYDFREEDIEKTLDALKLEGYFEYDSAYKKDEMVYCIVLKDKGKAYLRDKISGRKKLYIRLAITVLCAILAYLVRIIIGAITGR